MSNYTKKVNGETVKMTQAEIDARKAEEKAWAERVPELDPSVVEKQIAVLFSQLGISDQQALLPLLAENKLALEFGNMPLLASNVQAFSPSNQAQTDFINAVKLALGL